VLGAPGLFRAPGFFSVPPEELLRQKMSHSENSAPSPRRIRQASAPQNEILSEEERADLVCLADFPSGKSAHQAGTVLLPRIFWETFLAVLRSAACWPT
jgi:hypothetical protein